MCVCASVCLYVYMCVYVRVCACIYVGMQKSSWKIPLVESISYITSSSEIPLEIPQKITKEIRIWECCSVSMNKIIQMSMKNTFGYDEDIDCCGKITKHNTTV